MKSTEATFRSATVKRSSTSQSVPERLVEHRERAPACRAASPTAAMRRRHVRCTASISPGSISVTPHSVHLRHGVGRVARCEVLRVALREIQVDRHRLPEDQPVVVERGNAAVRIDLLELGRLCIARERGRDVLEGDTGLFEHPEATRRTRHCGSVELDHESLLRG
jgi:hypothetical protein